MKWIKQEHPVISSKPIRKYTIKPGSILDVPKVVLIGTGSFEERLKDYYQTQVKDTDFLIAMTAIYQIFDKEGGVDLHSAQTKWIKQRHEKVVLDLIKENLLHVKQVAPYFD